jgi:intracellular sulfur oxidation DsrE/DsrF family protein
MTEAATIVVQEKGIRILGGVTNKLEKYEFKDRTVVHAELVAKENGIAIAVVANNRRITAFSIPEVQRIAEIVLPNYVLSERLSHSFFKLRNRLHEIVITPDGDLFCWTDKMECSLFTMWGRGLKMSDIPADALFDAVKSVPARPTISNLQWIMGTQYIRTEDLNLLSIHFLRPTNV